MLRPWFNRVRCVACGKPLALLFAMCAVALISGCDNNDLSSQDIVGIVSAGVSLILTIVSFAV